MLTPVVISILYISICENEVRQGISTGDNVRVLKLITLAFYLYNGLNRSEVLELTSILSHLPRLALFSLTPSLF